MSFKTEKRKDKKLKEVKTASQEGQVAGAMEDEADEVLKRQKAAGIKPLTESLEELKDYSRGRRR